MRACLTGNATLALVAGITCFAFVCSQFWVFKSHTRRRPIKGIDVDTEAEKRKYRSSLFRVDGIDIDIEAEKRVDRISRLPDKHTEAEKTEDRISQLSDDVIHLIISRLYTRDAVRTSLLSKRWRHVYTFITEVRFHCRLMPETHSRGDHEGRKLSQSQMKFVEAVDTFLRRHSAIKMKSFKFTCCFTGYFLDIFRKWMSSNARLGVEQLIVEICDCSLTQLSYPPVFSSDFLPEASPVTGLRFLHTPNQNALKILELNNVAFTSEEVECILSNCSSLQSLKLIHCDLPSKFRIHGPDLQLKSLVLRLCLKVREIDLSAINLITLEIYHLAELKLSFSCVPLLQNLFIEFKDCRVTHVFGEAAGNLPHLECMFFKTYATCFEVSELYFRCLSILRKVKKYFIEQFLHLFQGYMMARVTNKFSSLRHLFLMLVSYNTLDLLSLTLILDLCPLLHKFHLSMMISSMFVGKQAEKRVVTCETRLKEFEFSGFSEKEHEYNFILYMLKNIVSLKQLSILLNARQYRLHFGDWAPVGSRRIDKKTCQIIRQQLQGQAISKDVDIIISE